MASRRDANQLRRERRLQPVDTLRVGDVDEFRRMFASLALKRLEAATTSLEVATEAVERDQLTVEDLAPDNQD